MCVNLTAIGREDDVVPVVATQTDLVSSHGENVACRQKNGPEIGVHDTENEGLKTGVLIVGSANVLTTATTGVGRRQVSGKCTGRRAQDSRDFLLLV